MYIFIFFFYLYVRFNHSEPFPYVQYIKGLIKIQIIFYLKGIFYFDCKMKSVILFFLQEKEWQKMKHIDVFCEEFRPLLSIKNKRAAWLSAALIYCVINIFYFKLSLKKASILSNGITSVLWYKSTWLAPGIIISSLLLPVNFLKTSSEK